MGKFSLKKLSRTKLGLLSPGALRSPDPIDKDAGTAEADAAEDEDEDEAEDDNCWFFFIS